MGRVWSERFQGRNVEKKGRQRCFQIFVTSFMSVAGGFWRLRPVIISRVCELSPIPPQMLLTAPLCLCCRSHSKCDCALIYETI